ncbi:MAG: ACP S-malonyltransferase [Pseudomonadales bacterium]|jgi:[acyl-carrier-protein] S-malonyltransferase|nr:ACP S-malonyltransferase [Pseudomonadales bacterium]
MTSRSLAMIFPGQGSQHVGMLAELAAAHPVVGATFDAASEALGYDLWQLVQNGPAEELALTHITQPVVLTGSVALWRLWREQGGAVPALLAGHSLGEYSALVAAGALAFRAAVALVEQRGKFMQSAVPLGTGSMVAIIGLEDEAVVAACASASGDEVVAAVNFNSPGQVVISGHVAAVNRAIEACKAAGAKRALPFPVSAPFHSPLMRPAAERFAEALAKVELRAPEIAVLHNVGIEPCTDPQLIRQKLVTQIYAPVPWVGTVNALAARGITRVLELGPGKVLAGFNKRIQPDMAIASVNDAASLAAALDV